MPTSKNWSRQIICWLPKKKKNFFFKVGKSRCRLHQKSATTMENVHVNSNSIVLLFTWTVVKSAKESPTSLYTHFCLNRTRQTLPTSGQTKSATGLPSSIELNSANPAEFIVRLLRLINRSFSVQGKLNQSPLIAGEVGSSQEFIKDPLEKNRPLEERRIDRWGKTF